ncbi:CheY chemotaxis protein or a CheY-like REC (receiver) domain [Marivirga sericea]|uniref:CheY chemotaxis protein or a CheY-like REC (Receiver) domain n=1 Tax=Marivirga sericea TaxID=1028 RepID=A0A1X7L4I8_9BACT|nr:response regulator [Marivirga sericea]SMG48303.1 CheY chemotaxis protein or a CheY-like REC (receiver) domain [Marivirga sericea]
MKKKLNCILLIDDDEATNFLHKSILEEADISEKIIVRENGEEAINFLTARLDDHNYPQPDLIFLDINMPVLDGWQFLQKYKKLPPQAKGKIVLFMLTTSLNPADRKRAEGESNVNGFKTKPLDEAMIDEILNEFYPEYL